MQILYQWRKVFPCLAFGCTNRRRSQVFFISLLHCAETLRLWRVDHYIYRTAASRFASRLIWSRVNMLNAMSREAWSVLAAFNRLYGHLCYAYRYTKFETLSVWCKSLRRLYIATMRFAGYVPRVYWWDYNLYDFSSWSGCKPKICSQRTNQSPLPHVPHRTAMDGLIFYLYGAEVGDSVMKSCLPDRMP